MTVIAKRKSTNSKGPWDEFLDTRARRPGSVSLTTLSEQMDLDIEICIFSNDWDSHIVIRKEEWVLEEDAKTYDTVFEPGGHEAGDYTTFDECRAFCGLPDGLTLKSLLEHQNNDIGGEIHNPDMTWEEFCEDECNWGECFRYDGFANWCEWVI